MRPRTKVEGVTPALAAMVLVLGACTATVTEQTTTTTTSPSSTPTQAPAPPQPDELEWERITDEAMLPTAGTAFGAIMAKPDGSWLIAGEVFDVDRAPHLHIWESPDGLSWEPQAVEGFDDGAFVNDATWHGNSGYVVGSIPSTGATPGLLLRVGDDGTTESLDVPELSDPAGLTLTYIASHPDQGILALGHTDPDPDTDWVAISSVDGVRWDREPALERLVNRSETGWVSAVEVGAAGRLVVVSDRTEETNVADVVFDDGSGWADRGPLPALGGVVVQDAIVTGEGSSVYGASQTDLAHEPAIWRAGPGGASWELIEPELRILDWHRRFDAYGWSFMRAVPTPDGYTGVVYASASYIFVRSSDGVTWEEVPLPEAIFDTDVPYPGSLAVGEGGVMAVSTSRSTPAVFAVTGESAAQVVDPGLPAPGDVITMSQALALDDGVLVVGAEQLWSPDLAVDADHSAASWTVTGDSVERAQVPGGNLFLLQDAHLLSDGGAAMVGFEYFAESIVSQRHISSGVWLRQEDQVEKVESDSFQSDGSQRMYGITELADGTLAVIGHRYADEHLRITFWVSSDEGVTWQNVRQPEVEDATLNPEINDVCPLPAGGAIGIGGHGVDGATPAVWLTEDGKSWEAAVVDGDPFGGGFNTLNRCNADGDRTYVVGAHGSPHSASPHSAAVWTTTDGRSFTRLDHGAFPDFTSVWDIEVFADGRIWIVGPIWAAEGSGAGTIVELDDTGAIMQLERLDAPEFIGPTGFANVWSITGTADNIILLGDFGDSVAVWRASLP